MAEPPGQAKRLGVKTSPCAQPVKRGLAQATSSRAFVILAYCRDTGVRPTAVRFSLHAAARWQPRVRVDSTGRRHDVRPFAHAGLFCL
jgi:hypothetical protein